MAESFQPAGLAPSLDSLAWTGPRVTFPVTLSPSNAVRAWFDGGACLRALRAAPRHSTSSWSCGCCVAEQRQRAATLPAKKWRCLRGAVVLSASPRADERPRLAAQTGGRGVGHAARRSTRPSERNCLVDDSHNGYPTDAAGSLGGDKPRKAETRVNLSGPFPTLPSWPLGMTVGPWHKAQGARCPGRGLRDCTWFTAKPGSGSAPRPSPPPASRPQDPPATAGPRRPPQDPAGPARDDGADRFVWRTN